MANDSTPEGAILSEFLFQGSIAAQFAGYLAKNSSLKTARFMRCDFADDAIDGREMIADAISRNTSLERLHMHQCTVGLRLDFPVHLCVCMCVYVYTYVLMYVRTYIHTYIHTYVCMCA